MLHWLKYDGNELLVFIYVERLENCVHCNDDSCEIKL